MSIAEKINRYVQRLPEHAQVGGLDFVEFLAHKSEQRTFKQQAKLWAKGALSSAMREMESEAEPEYWSADITEHFARNRPDKLRNA